MIEFTSLNKALAILLDLPDKLFVSKVLFNDEINEIHVYIDAERGTKYTCPCCYSKNKPVHDRHLRTWRHKDVIDCRLYIHYNIPRVKCDLCGVHTINVPWSRKKSNYTFSFEQHVINSAMSTPIIDIADLLNEYDDAIWRIIFFYINVLFKDQNWCNVTRLGVDEVSSKKGHNYITNFLDMESHKIIFSTPGKDASTIEKMAIEMSKHFSTHTQILEVSIDMSPAFIKGVKAFFPNASITFDKFHVLKHINEALDKVRRTESKKNPILKGTRYLWLHNEGNLTYEQKEQLKTLTKENLQTARAYQMKLTFFDIYKHINNKFNAKIAIQKWINWSMRCRIPQMKDVGRLIKDHLDGILRYWESNLTNNVIEAINLTIQNVKRRSRGFRNVEYFITMVYLVAGNLPLDDLMYCLDVYGKAVKETF
jgi:transposase